MYILIAICRVWFWPCEFSLAISFSPHYLVHHLYVLLIFFFREFTYPFLDWSLVAPLSNTFPLIFYHFQLHLFQIHFHFWHFLSRIIKGEACELCIKHMKICLYVNLLKITIILPNLLYMPQSIIESILLGYFTSLS